MAHSHYQLRIQEWDTLFYIPKKKPLESVELPLKEKKNTGSLPQSVGVNSYSVHESSQSSDCSLSTPQDLIGADFGGINLWVFSFMRKVDMQAGLGSLQC